jgi:hypothetical protein
MYCTWGECSICLTLVTALYMTIEEKHFLAKKLLFCSHLPPLGPVLQQIRG